MVFAAGSRAYLAYIVESTFGTTPATPELLELRTMGHNINLTKETLESEEIRSDRQITDVRHGNNSVVGDINVELSDLEYETFLEAVLGGTWATDVLKAGTTFRSFTMERGFEDIAQFLVYKGVVLNTMSVQLAVNAMATATFGVLGKSASAAAGTTIDTTPGLTPVGTSPPYDSFSGSINEGGSAIATVTALEFNLNNGAEQNFVIGDTEAPQTTLGRSNITGQITAYFEDETLLNKFVGETVSSLDVTLTTGSGEGLTFDFPSIKYTGGDIPVDGEGSRIITLPFQALRDDSEASNIVITRNV